MIWDNIKKTIPTPGPLLLALCFLCYGGQWTANERIGEEQESGAQAMITASGWCERNFRDAVEESGK